MQGSNNHQLSFGGQVEYINQMQQAAQNANGPVDNHLPVAIATIGAAHVTLDGSRSHDPKKSASLLFKWQQISGPQVTLHNDNRPQVSFELGDTQKDLESGASG
ncbi:hypothetical protein AB1287_17485 [Enterobacter asburiae]|uniref:PKD domain-containing protein n=1 Tax=Scandinavium sp. UTDF21-P1B TaxID=3446379 RepID=UPI0034728F3A